MSEKTKINTTQSQLTVACPRWLQKRMRKNLQAAARNKVSPVRAKKALQVLISHKRKQKP